jgi:aspartate/tyrosine/aromatic aminotransferase
VILLHGCAHNPTGIDPTKEQWDVIADVIQEKGHLTFFDVAYQVMQCSYLGLLLIDLHGLIHNHKKEEVCMITGICKWKLR